jgi:hypothetical protein
VIVAGVVLAAGALALLLSLRVMRERRAKIDFPLPLDLLEPLLEGAPAKVSSNHAAA